MAGNTQNIEDSPLVGSIVVAFFTLTILYVLYRAGCLLLLGKNLCRDNPGGRMTAGWKLRMGMVLWPALFAFFFILRTINHELSNACAAFVPIAYLVRFVVHTNTLAYQALALFPIKIDPRIFLRNKWLPSTIYFLLCVPVVGFCLAMWGLNLGARLGNVCTLGPATPDEEPIFWNISVFSFAAEVLEILYIIGNALCEYFLRESTMLGPLVQYELLNLSRVTTALICYDIVFRFTLAQKFFAAVIPVGNTLNTIQEIYFYIFLAVYGGGLTMFTARILEHDTVNYFKLSPFSMRYYKLLFNREKLSDIEIMQYFSYKACLISNRKRSRPNSFFSRFFGVSKLLRFCGYGKKQRYSVNPDLEILINSQVQFYPSEEQFGTSPRSSFIPQLDPSKNSPIPPNSNAAASHTI